MVSMGVQISVWDPDSILLNVYGRSGISDHISNFLRNLHIDSHGTNLYSREQYIRVPFSSCILINTCVSYLCALDARCLSDINVQIFATIPWVLPLLIVDSALFCKENFILMMFIQLNLFPFCCLCFSCPYCDSTAKSQVVKMYCCAFS